MPESNDKPFRVIIADDNETALRLLGQIVEKTVPGSIVVGVADGEAAMVEFDKNGANLLIVDHKMPVIDGPALIHSIRAKHVKIPIIVVSGHKYARQEALSAGATCFLEKADAPHQLAHVLTAFVRDT